MMLGKEQSWAQWLRACSRDPASPAKLGQGVLGMLTGQDGRALAAIAQCWKLYALSDEAGQRAALAAVMNLLGALQPKCHFFAKELIAYAMDWDDREKLWPLVSGRSSS